jgi:hypothetical protein
MAHKVHEVGRRVLLASLALLGACTTAVDTSPPPMRPDEVRALVVRLMPASVPDRAGWAADVYAAFSTLGLRTTPESLCAALAVTEQESSYRADPSVPGLARIAWAEIDKRAERAGVPLLVVHGALKLTSPDGRSYAERLDAVTTERQLSEIFEDFIGMVPLGKSFLASSNPVRTGGPMQVSITFAETQAAAQPYPYPVQGSVRHEVFTRRGGLYFGIAHLLAYDAPYEQMRFRFADFNAGRHASRNAAFQAAVSLVSGIPLALDGDLLPPGGVDAANPGATQRAVESLAARLDLSLSAIRRDLAQGDAPGFAKTRLYERVFALADRLDRRPQPRAVLPRITLQSPKITRTLTTEWFAQRVDERHQRCLARAAAAH